MRLDLGTPLVCADGQTGELMDVVIDPVSRRLTHLVARIPRRFGTAVLVPIALVNPDGGVKLALVCSSEEASKLEHVEDVAFVRLGEFPANDSDWDVGVQSTLALRSDWSSELGPYYDYETPVGITYDRVPKGEVEIRRLSAVVTVDGRVVGHVQGLVIDTDDHITDVVVARGRLWRRREMAVPISAVKTVETDSVTVSLTTRELRALPSARQKRP